MGYYLNPPEAGAVGKAKALIDHHGAYVLDAQPHEFPSDTYALICVVNNGAFEAAALCFSPKELAEFSQLHDPRAKTWLLMNPKTAHEMAGYTP